MDNFISNHMLMFTLQTVVVKVHVFVGSNNS